MTQDQALLEEKSVCVQEELETWAREQGLLRAGQTLVFSLRIEEHPLVCRDPHDREPFTISRQCRAGFEGAFLQPARLAEEQARALILRLPPGRTRRQARELLIENSNAPARLYMDVVQKINRALREPFNGMHYRIALGKDASGAYGAQLWEVAPP